MLTKSSLCSPIKHPHNKFLRRDGCTGPWMQKYYFLLLMGDINAEIQVNLWAFLEEQTSKWFFFRHNSALNRGVLIHASLTFGRRGNAPQVFPRSQPDPWLWDGGGLWVFFSQEKPRFGEFRCLQLWVALAGVSVSGDWALELGLEGCQLSGKGSSRAGSTTCNSQGSCHELIPESILSQGSQSFPCTKSNIREEWEGKILHSWGCAAVESWQAKGRQGDSLLMAWFILSSC